MQIIKDFFNGITGGSNDKAEEKAKETYDVDDLKEELRKVEEENKRLKEEIEAKNKEIEKLKTGK